MIKNDNKTIFLPGLNGIRAIAAIGVMFSHINHSLKRDYNIDNVSLFGFKDNGQAKSWVLGEHGVTMFFVLSGFLITYLLIKEINKTDTINIKSFYIRRALRIWPLYYLYLFITILIVYLFIHYELGQYIWYYVFFMANVPFALDQSFTAINHLWSIGVEEQFYLFWPFLFLFFYKKRFFKHFLLGLILLQFFVRIFLWYKYPFSTAALFSVINRFDCMMLGGLGAILYLEKSKIIELIDSFWIQLLSWIIIGLMFFNAFHFFNSILETFSVSLITVIAIIGQINLKNKIVNLEIPILSYLGKLSFGIYVYHPLIMLLYSQLFKQLDLNVNEMTLAISCFILIFVTTIMVAHLSYYKFEKKFLKLKTKFAIIKSSNEKI